MNLLRLLGPAVVIAALAVSTPTSLAQSAQEQPLPDAPRPALAPVVVSITAKNAPIEEVFAQLQRQAHINLAPATAGTPRRVTLELHDKPLWEILKAALDQSPTTPLAAWKMDVGDTSPFPGLTDYKGVLSARGPFLVIAGAAEHEFNFQRADDTAERITLQIQLITDSSAAVVAHSYFPRVLNASFDNGDLLVDPNASSHDVSLFQSDVRGSFPLLLHPVKPSTIRHRSLALVEGEIPADIVATVQTVTLPLPGSLTIPYLDQNVIVTAEAARPAIGNPRGAAPGSPSVASVRLQLKFPPPDPPMPQAQQIRFSRALEATRATASDGPSNFWTNQRILGTGGGTTPFRLEITMTAAPNTPLPKKITLQLPTAMAQIKIPFHFENIPLP